MKSLWQPPWGRTWDISGPNGHLVVDIGRRHHGCGGADHERPWPFPVRQKPAGEAFDEAIVRYARRKYGVVIGQTMAEEVKITIGASIPGLATPA